MISAANRVEIDAVDFQISCRRFTIRASVTTDRQLPVVDEFVLRLLAVAERMPIARLRAWFGFSESEIQTVLVDIARRKYIEFEGDDVTLGPPGRDLFRSLSVDGVPQVVEVLPLVDAVWFDLVSRSMVPRSRRTSTDYCVKLAEQPNTREFPEAFARQAFEENFREYTRNVRRFPEPDKINLYAISDIEGGPYGYQTLQARLVFDTERLVTHTTFPDIGDDTAAFRKLTVAANDAWQNASGPEPAASSATEFERLTGRGDIAALITSPTLADNWIEAMASDGGSKGYIPTIGATYLAGNLGKLVDRIASSDNALKGGELTWLRPSGSTWGRTARVADALQQLRTAWRNAGGGDLTAILAMPRSTHNSVRAQHRRIFDKGAILPSGHLPANLEILHIPGIAALVNVHISMGRHSVPIGCIVKEEKRLSRIAERLNPAKAAGWETHWQPTNAKASEHEPTA